MKFNNHSFCRTILMAVGLTGASFSQASMAHADWPMFRGPNAGSVAIDAKLPTQFGGEKKENIAWRTELPGRSVGGVIVVGDSAITTSSSGMDQRRLHLISVNTQDGVIRWQQEFVARGRPFCHPTSANAAPTPASDGKHIFAFYSSNDLACVDLEGNLVWYRSLSTDFPKAGNDVGMSSSPVVVDGVCVVQIECQGDSFAAGLSAEDGKILWKLDRPRQANWSSPTIVTMLNGDQVVVMQSSEDLLAVSPKTGKVLWEMKLRCSTIPSSFAAEGRLIVPQVGLRRLTCLAWVLVRASCGTTTNSVQTHPLRWWLANLSTRSVVLSWRVVIYSLANSNGRLDCRMPIAFGLRRSWPETTCMFSATMVGVLWSIWGTQRANSWRRTNWAKRSSGRLRFPEMHCTCAAFRAFGRSLKSKQCPTLFHTPSRFNQQASLYTVASPFQALRALPTAP